MERWIQLLMAVISLLRLVMELPEWFYRWRERIRKEKKTGGKKKKLS